MRPPYRKRNRTAFLLGLLVGVLCWYLDPGQLARRAAALIAAGEAAGAAVSPSVLAVAAAGLLAAVGTAFLLRRRGRSSPAAGPAAPPPRPGSKEAGTPGDLCAALVQNLHDFVCLQDGEGRWIQANRAALAVFGLEGVEWRGKTSAELSKAAGCPVPVFLTCHDLHESAWAAGRPVRQEQVVPQSSGGPKAFEVTKIPLFRPDGTRRGLVVHGRDITRQKLAERLLAYANERFLTLAENLDAEIYVADMKTYEVLFANRKVRNRLGDITGQTCWKVFQKGRSGPCDFCTNDRLLTPDGKPAGVVAWESNKAVTGAWHECRDFAIRWTDGRLVRIQVAVDVTDRKALERERQQLIFQLQQALAEAKSLAQDHNPDPF
ncbi:PAS domain-containing protein [Dissulfurirhabdus thermomarina]|uniref:PAS domain-containing protein n=1 Tax=Dissulfurirhabdus thermomarina TaxID=1765737 RepID=A0A6N9TUB1_DISTH|nr:PAS domain-containing protein [Dissulfurirhabdus thermomarina]NDY43324.1 PAS domain-containing protein [Dissulfurirhabdus thermomarina]NMX24280.1 PAS domain-containing protein [Dissulfurirhabdus thermomarina]